MKKFAIELVKGNNTTILKTFDTKDEALTAGKEYRKKYTRDQGLIDCIYAEFDENDNMTDKSYKLFETWN